MKILPNSSNRFDVIGIDDPDKKGIAGYKGICKIWGWILEKIFRKAVSIKTDGGKVYLNCKSFVHWLKRVDPNHSLSKEKLFKFSHRSKFVKRAISKLAARILQPTVCKVPIGLKNLGFSCYLNAILQILFQIPEIRDSIALNPEKPILKQLKELLDRKTASESESILRSLREEIFLRAGSLAFWTEGVDRKFAQQDAFEAFTFITEILNWYPMKLASRLRWGDISNIVESYQTNHLSLAIEKGDQIDLQFLICNFFKEEHIEGEVFCDIKGTRYRSDQWRKSFQICIFPEYFLLQLSRYDYDRNKITTPIALKDTVWLPDGEKKVEYEIAALVNHHGSTMGSGHYTADVKVAGSEGKAHWFHCDDSNVKEQNKSSVSKDAYLILLKKR